MRSLQMILVAARLKGDYAMAHTVFRVTPGCLVLVASLIASTYAPCQGATGMSAEEMGLITGHHEDWHVDCYPGAACAQLGCQKPPPPWDENPDHCVYIFNAKGNLWCKRLEQATKNACMDWPETDPPCCQKSECTQFPPECEACFDCNAPHDCTRSWRNCVAR